MIRPDKLRLHLGPAPSGSRLEVITIVRDDGSEQAIHATTRRPKYTPLLEGE